MQSGPTDQPQLQVPLSRWAVSSVSLGSTDLLQYIELLPMNQLLYHDVQAVRAWPESASNELLAELFSSCYHFTAGRPAGCLLYIYVLLV